MIIMIRGLDDAEYIDDDDANNTDDDDKLASQLFLFVYVLYCRGAFSSVATHNFYRIIYKHKKIKTNNKNIQ